MYQGKHIKKSRKPAVLLASLALAVTVAVAGTLAFLATQTQPVENTFVPTSVPPTVIEELVGGVKNNVTIQNGGNIDAYIRATVAINWVKDNGDGTTTVYGVPPVSGTDYQIVWTPDSDSDDTNGIQNDWVLGADGLYYCKRVVKAGESTDVLLTGCQVIAGKEPAGYNLSVEILAQTIQADGVAADGTPPVVAAWGAENGGSVTGVNSGKLLIKTEEVSGE